MAVIERISERRFDHEAEEEKCRDLWERSGIHAYRPDAGGPVYAVDTPPPYVSAAHLHVGHAMSYSQAEFIVRFKRMSGFNIYYPMGFDDNGLPTERYVEATEGVSGRLISRSEFRRLCMEVTRQGATVYEGLWRDLGLSVDWTLRFSTIDDRCRRTAQLSFIDLYHKGLLYRAEDPVLWDTKLETALAQADLDWISRRSELHTIRFLDTEGNTLPISTTRPELLAACVAVFWHPADTRYRGRLSKQAVVPMFGQTVPVLCSEDVNPEFGTGLMMVCTFGDGEDVKKWKEHGLMTRICVDDTGRSVYGAGASDRSKAHFGGS